MMSDVTAEILRGALEREARELEARLRRLLFMEDLTPGELAQRYVIRRQVERDGSTMRLVTTIEPRDSHGGPEAA